MYHVIKNPQKLLQIADNLLADPHLVPEFNQIHHVIRTHCNMAAHIMYYQMGGPGFLDDKKQPFMADQIICLMEDTPKIWRLIDLGGVQNLADQGSLVFGCATSKELIQEHGHICTVIPGKPEPSEHWGCDAPYCINIGQKNFIGGMNWAFQKPPSFYVWIDSL
jgi:hypothetical protein